MKPELNLAMCSNFILNFNESVLVNLRSYIIPFLSEKKQEHDEFMDGDLQKPITQHVPTGLG